jgi:DNA-directed RNA polymerase alpha subunit
MQFAHWLMVAGAALVVLGFIGFVVRKNDAEPAGNNLEPATQSRAEGEEEMSDEKRSTDPGLSAAERKKLRGREAKEAIADHEGAQRALHGNLDRLRAERLAREATTGPMLYPASELPDDTPIDRLRLSTRIRNVLNAAGLKTVGEIRQMSDDNLLALQDFGPGSVTSLRETLGPSTEGVSPTGKKP